METVLIISEIFFYFTVSFAIITIGILSLVIAQHLVNLIKELEGLSHNLKLASSEAGERISEIIERISDLPILSYFLKKRPLSIKRKSREKLNINK